MIMVPVAQLAERQIVALEVVGSNPIGHPQAENDALRTEMISAQGIGVYCAPQARETTYRQFLALSDAHDAYSLAPFTPLLTPS